MNIRARTNNVDVQRGLEYVLTISAVGLWLTVIYYAYTQMMPRAQYGVVFLGAVIWVYIIDEFRQIAEGEITRRDWVDVGILSVVLLVVVVTTGYMYLNFDDLYLVRRGFALTREHYIATAFAIVMTYLAWRSFGRLFLFIVLVTLAYGYFGPYFPGVTEHGGLTIDRLRLILVMDLDGFYGFLTQLVAAWIALFLLYAGLLEGYGAFSLIFRGAAHTAKYIDSGVAQTAVIASAIVGSINGSQTANAGMTGAFTIPMMKDSGIRPATAAGIEAVASTKGQVLPPVMGAGAFIMASLLGIAYIDVILAGLIPATIMVVAVVVAVHYTATNQIEGIDMDQFIEEELTGYEVTFDVMKFAIPFFVLVYTLGIAEWTVMTAALYTAVTMMITGITFPLLKSVYLNRDFHQLGGVFLETIGDTIQGFKRGAVITAPIALILAVINGVVDILLSTGVPGMITLTLMDLTGGTLLYAVVISMVICILLGLGMPTTAAYTVVALLVAPTLINQFLVPELAAHYFVFYGAILSGLTPPIATCAAVAAGVAKADFMETCYEAVKIAAPIFILPFSFIYTPEIVSGSFSLETLFISGLILIGALAVILGMNYPFKFNRGVNGILRGIYFSVGTVVMVYPDTWVKIVGAAVLVGLFIMKAVVVEYLSDLLRPVLSPIR
ncbi:TRAP transporter permease [Natrialbaceae archaeon A-gly3]